MIVFVFSIYDEKAGAFAAPFTAPSIGHAIRSFADEVNSARDSSLLSKHPEDFQLFELGMFDDSDGSFDLLPAPSPRGNGLTYRLDPEGE